MRIADLINIEAQIARDSETAYEELLVRDHGLVPVDQARTLERSALLERWIHSVSEGSDVGTHAVQGYRFAAVALVCLGAALGVGTARATLHYDGSHPVNVLYFLFVFVVVQIGLALGSVAVAAVRMARRDQPLSSFALIGFVNRWLARWLARVPADAVERWRSAWERLRRQSKPYRAVEFWWLFSQAHGFGLAFNGAAVGTLVYLVSFSDLAFAWSTTLDIDSARFSNWIGVLGAPWAWFWPEAVPSEAVVEATRYSRLTATYVAGARSTADPLLVGRWWMFLLGAALTYGVAPRALLLVLARGRLAWTLRHLPLDTPDIDRVVARLQAPLVETGGEQSLSGPGESPRETGVSQVGAGVRQVQLLFWRDAPSSAADRVATHFASRFGWSLAGHRELDAGTKLVAAEDVDTAWVVVAEGWEAPDKGFRRTLGNLRDQLGRDRSIFVALLDAEASMVQTWTRTLQALEDPYLTTEHVP